jgi:LysM repeat protein
VEPAAAPREEFEVIHEYLAKDGETLQEIATRFTVATSELFKYNETRYNGLKETSELQGETSILIPKIVHEYLTEDNETLQQISVKFDVSVHDLLALNQSRYKRLTDTSALKKSTSILTPAKPSKEKGDGSDSDCFVQVSLTLPISHS